MKLKALIGVVIVCLAGVALGASLSGHFAAYSAAMAPPNECPPMNQWG